MTTPRRKSRSGPSGPNIPDEQRHTKRLNLRIGDAEHAQIVAWDREESAEFGARIGHGEVVEDLVRLRRAIDAIDPELRVQLVWSQRTPDLVPAPTGKQLAKLRLREP